MCRDNGNKNITIENIIDYINESFREYFMFSEDVILNFVDTYQEDLKLIDINIYELKEKITSDNQNFKINQETDLLNTLTPYKTENKKLLQKFNNLEPK